MSAILLVEGGGDSKELHARCREGFRKLLEKCGYRGRMPRIVACGSRSAAFRDFEIEHRNDRYDFVAMLIDSEEPLQNLKKTWTHLQRHDKWMQPSGTTDAQILFMTTCMETWIVADRGALRHYFGGRLRESALPSTTDLEERWRDDIQRQLADATKDCPNKYSKGKRSFALLAVLDPTELERHLPSFARANRILTARLS